jgi:hypothetical protein
MSRYEVLINDNAHFMDESERSAAGLFGSAEEAVTTCKRIVDDDLNSMWKPGETAESLYQLYVAFGPDPFVVRVNRSDPDVTFSAWAYAKERCQDVIANRAGRKD